MSESALYPAIIGAHSHGPTRLFRQQTGLAWQGTVIEHTARRLVLAHPRAIRSGVPGMSDIGGLTAHEVSREDIGRTLAVYLGIEAKTRMGRLTAEQASFIAMVRSLGGRAGVARTVEEAGEIIAGRY